MAKDWTSRIFQSERLWVHEHVNQTNNLDYQNHGDYTQIGASGSNDSSIHLFWVNRSRQQLNSLQKSLEYLPLPHHGVARKVNTNYSEIPHFQCQLNLLLTKEYFMSVRYPATHMNGHREQFLEPEKQKFYGSCSA